MTFEPGNVVVLKSGGQTMTVVAVADSGAECLWLGDEGDLFRETIPAVALELVHGELGDQDRETGDEDEDDDRNDGDEGEDEAEDEKRPAA